MGMPEDTKATLSPKSRILTAETDSIPCKECHGVFAFSKSRVDAQLTDDMTLKGILKGVV